jgi:hypothetical protein
MPKNSKGEEVDIEQLTLDEIRKLAEEEAAETNKTEQPRNDDGTFKKAETKVEAEEEPEQKTVSFRRVIKGVNGQDEIFEAPTLEELVDKIAEAKAHATKKIHDQEEEIKKHKKEEAQVSSDQEFVYSQELLSKPTEAFKRLFKDMTGVDIEQFKTTHARSQAIFDAQQQTAERQKASDDFVTGHPEYVDSEKNAKLLKDALELSKDYSLHGFEKAYQFLQSSGLLESKSEEAHAATETKEQTEERITPKTEVQVTSQRTKKASGVSTKGRPAAAVVNTMPTEDEAFKMPLEDLRKLANRQLKGEIKFNGAA